MKGKDLISIGIFPAICFVTVFIIAMLGMIPIFLLLSVLVPISSRLMKKYFEKAGIA